MAQENTNIIEISGKIPEIQKINENYDKILAENTKLKSDIASLRSDLEKLKGQMVDKISKPILIELEGKITNHGKAIETSQRKVSELQCSLLTYTQQPISHGIIENMRKQVTDDVIENMKKIFDPQFEGMKKLIEDKNNETRGLVNNAKRFMFQKK